MTAVEKLQDRYHRCDFLDYCRQGLGQCIFYYLRPYSVFYDHYLQFHDMITQTKSQTKSLQKPHLFRYFYCNFEIFAYICKKKLELNP